MITLSIPSPDQCSFVIQDGFLVGPFGRHMVTQSLSYRYDTDQLLQGDRMFDESNVDHSQVNGNLLFFPAYKDVSPAPTSTCPQRVAWKYRNGTTIATLYADYGVAAPVGYFFDTVNKVHRVLVYEGPEKVTRYLLIYNSDGTIYECDQVVYDTFSWVSDFVADMYYHQRWLYPTGSARSSGWNVRKSPDEVIAKVIEVVSSRAFSNASYRWAGYKTYSQAPLYLESAREMVNSTIFQSLQLEFPAVDPTDYGSLAQKAVSSIDANNVNMFAFLRDLRHPQEMIPKLKNLSQLKTIAGNYLSVHYGVMPTIDDLSSIISAFKSALPYRDKFGFKTYNAANVASSSAGSLSHILEQRIKIAIEDNDSEFYQLLDRLSDMGFDLTLQNVWDLIPYSFVLDWFIDVGGFLERIDTRLRILRLNIRYVTMSQKEYFKFAISANSNQPFNGPVELVRYSRWTQDQCPVPPLLESSTGSPSSHWLEAGALIAQRHH